MINVARAPVLALRARANGQGSFNWAQRELPSGVRALLRASCCGNSTSGAAAEQGRRAASLGRPGALVWPPASPLRLCLLLHLPPEPRRPIDRKRAGRLARLTNASGRRWLAGWLV